MPAHPLLTFPYNIENVLAIGATTQSDMAIGQLRLYDAPNGDYWRIQGSDSEFNIYSSTSGNPPILRITQSDLTFVAPNGGTSTGTLYINGLSNTRLWELPDKSGTFAMVSDVTGGPQGSQGLQGPQGSAGSTGSAGSQGPQGLQGITGSNGSVGVTGSQGLQGPQGSAGSTGSAGSQGPQGSLSGLTFSGATNSIPLWNSTTGLTSSIMTQTDGIINIPGSSLTGSTANSLLNLSQTWNTTGSPTAIKLDVTNTGSTSSSKLIDLSVGGSSRFLVGASGGILGASGGSIGLSSRFLISGSADGVIQLASSTSTALARLVLGLANSSNPALKPNGAGLDVINGANSAFVTVSSLYDRTGNGSPEGVTTAPIGSIYHNITGVTGTSLYVKERGTTSSGWSTVVTTTSLGYTSKGATYSVTASDYIIDCTSGTFTVTLPTAVGISSKNYIVKNSGSGTITLATTSSQTIDGVTTKTLNVQYSMFNVVSDGSNWKIIAQI